MTTFTRNCGLDAALAIIGGKWKPIVLFHLYDGSRRYGELKRLVTGITEKVLIQQLKELCEDRVIVRNDYKELPPRVDYTITEFGKTLAVALVPLCEWGTANRTVVEDLLASKQSKTKAPVS